MPQSLSRILVHLVFSTRSREPALHVEIRPRLHAYLAVVLRDNDCPPLQVGGVADHVHLLFGLSRTRSLAHVVEALKTSSSKWLKSLDPALYGFLWQAGYAAFSVDHASGPVVTRYIRDQDEHHRTLPFQDELRTILRRHEVACDERYLWD